MSRVHLLVVTVASGAGLLGWWLGFSSSAAGASVGGETAREELAALRQDVRGLQRAVDGLTRRLEREQPTTGLVSPAPTAARASEVPQATVNQVQELQSAVEQLQASVQSWRAESVQARQASASPSLDQLREEKREVDWGAWDTFISDWHLDQEQAAGELKLVTGQELMNRYGPPTEVWSNEKGMHWIYGRDYDPVAEKYATEIYLRFHDGQVTTVWVETP